MENDITSFSNKLILGVLGVLKSTVFTLFLFESRDFKARNFRVDREVKESDLNKSKYLEYKRKVDKKQTKKKHVTVQDYKIL